MNMNKWLYTEMGQPKRDDGGYYRFRMDQYWARVDKMLSSPTLSSGETHEALVLAGILKQS
jgi:hypothetical protein